MNQKIVEREGVKFTYLKEAQVNSSSLQPQNERATVAELNAKLILPNNAILDVSMDFDSDSGYHNNAIIVMNDFGAALLRDAIAHRFGDKAGEQVMHLWQTKRTASSPRKPTFLFVKPVENEYTAAIDRHSATTECGPFLFSNASNEHEAVYIFSACGDEEHDKTSPYKFISANVESSDSFSTPIQASTDDSSDKAGM